MKELIQKAMRRIARRKPGRTRLVYDRATKTIMVVDRSGNKTPSGLIITDTEADLFAT